jgi:hypothetical protein
MNTVMERLCAIASVVFNIATIFLDIEKKGTLPGKWPVPQPSEDSPKKFSDRFTENYNPGLAKINRLCYACKY